MLAIEMRRKVRSRRGQTLVLGSLGVLLVAVMMLLTLNVGQAVHEKIRIQQLADASAFSMATQEARAYNYVAYTNRANVGALVSAASLHSFQGMASSIPEMFQAAGFTFFMHAGIEFAMCLTCCWPYCFSMCEHCYHGISDLNAAFTYLDSADEYREEVNEVDDWFDKAMLALDAHMIYIAGDQKIVLLAVWEQILSDKITVALRDKIAPQAATNAEALRIKNAGFIFDLPDIQGGSRGFSDALTLDAERMKYVPTMIANGTRWSDTQFGFSLNNWFVSSRNLLEAYAFTHPSALMKLLFEDGEAADGFSFPIQHEGQGRIIKDPDSPQGKILDRQKMGPDGNSVGAYDSGWIMSMGFICIFSMIPMVMTYSAHISSGPDGGTHEDPSSCSKDGDHKFYCLDTTLGPAGCFAVFDPDPDPKHNFGQPAVFSVIKQDLSMMKGGGKGTWEVDLQSDAQGTINLDFHGQDGPVEVHIANNQSNLPNEHNKGVAMSKALVYYHYPRYTSDGWKEHPNLFNPYWRAKLHPFREVGLDNPNLTALEVPVVLWLGGVDESILEAVPGAPLP